MPPTTFAMVRPGFLAVDSVWNKSEIGGASLLVMMMMMVVMMNVFFSFSHQKSE